MVNFLGQNITFKMDGNALQISARNETTPKALFSKTKHS
jgi:hypothetical protein